MSSSSSLHGDNFERENGNKHNVSTFSEHNLLRVCSALTEEVTLEPYKASYSTLLDLFGGRQQVSFAEFSKVVLSLYNRIEREQLNLIIHINDFNAILNEVTYLTDRKG